MVPSDLLPVIAYATNRSASCALGGVHIRGVRPQRKAVEASLCAMLETFATAGLSDMDLHLSLARLPSLLVPVLESVGLPLKRWPRKVSEWLEPLGVPSQARRHSSRTSGLILPMLEVRASCRAHVMTTKNVWTYS